MSMIRIINKFKLFISALSRFSIQDPQTRTKKRMWKEEALVTVLKKTITFLKKLFDPHTGHWS
jgi:hypothetical protein